MSLRAKLSLVIGLALTVVISNPSAALASPAEDNPIAGLSTTVRATDANGKSTQKRVPVSTLSESTAPSNPTQRQAWEDAPKKQHYSISADSNDTHKDVPITPAAVRNAGKTLEVGDNNVVSRDPVTLDECKDHDSNPSEKPFWYKNKFSSCFAGTYTLTEPGCLLCPLKQINMNVDIIGVGYISYIQGGQPKRVMQYTIRTRQAYADKDAFDLNLPVTLAFKCSTQGRESSCGSSPSSFTKPLGEWWRGTTTTTDLTVTGFAEDTEPLPLENRTYHNVSFTFTQPNPAIEPMEVSSQEQSVRCDGANYDYYLPLRNRPNGACMFTNVDSWLQYNLSSTAHGEVAQHIYDAQFRAEERTKPGILDRIIPGSRQSGYKLHRIAPISQENEAAKNRNHAVAVGTCVEFWGPGYTENQTKECDEYPFQSTWEGAAYLERQPGPQFGYSARPVLKAQNGSAGGSLQWFYVWDHILEKDGFYVEIHD